MAIHKEQCPRCGKIVEGKYVINTPPKEPEVLLREKKSIKDLIRPRLSAAGSSSTNYVTPKPETDDFTFECPNCGMTWQRSFPTFSEDTLVIHSIPESFVLEKKAEKAEELRNTVSLSKAIGDSLFELFIRIMILTVSVGPCIFFWWYCGTHQGKTKVIKEFEGNFLMEAGPREVIDWNYWYYLFWVLKFISIPIAFFILKASFEDSSILGKVLYPFHHRTSVLEQADELEKMSVGEFKDKEPDLFKEIEKAYRYQVS